MRSTIVVCGVLALLVGQGCSGSETDSSTPRITATQNEMVSPGDVLITTSDLQSLGLGPLQVGDLADVPLYENPDPRGPCGAVSPPTPLKDVTARAFNGETAVVVNLVQPVTEETSAYHDALRSDLRENCAPFESTTNQGLTQRVDQIETVATDGSDVVAATSRINVGGQQFWSGVISAAGDNWYSLIQIQSTEPLDGAALAELAASAFDRVASA